MVRRLFIVFLYVHSEARVYPLFTDKISKYSKLLKFPNRMGKYTMGVGCLAESTRSHYCTLSLLPYYVPAHLCLRLLFNKYVTAANDGGFGDLSK